MEYHYFISYQISSHRGNSGILRILENTEVVRKKIIDSIEEIREIEQEIKSSYGFDTLAIKIINFQLLRSKQQEVITSKPGGINEYP